MKSIKRILATILMLAMVFTTAMGTFTVSAAVTCSGDLVVVDDDFASAKKGSTVSATVAGTTYTGKMGTTAFATLTDALAAVNNMGSIYVAAGVYSGKLEIDKAVNFYGNMMDVNPNNASEISKANPDRAVTGAYEAILQDTAIAYKPLGLDEVSNSNYPVVINGFAFAGDSCINLNGERYGNARINITNNVFDLINEKAYTNIGFNSDSFSGISLGMEEDFTKIAADIKITNNRIERIGSTGSGLTSTNGLMTNWATTVLVEGNYIANVTGMGFSVAQLQSSTKVLNNYIYNAAKTQMYNNINGVVEISGNTFDTVGGNTAAGQYAFGIYATGTATNYACQWATNVENVLIFENTFKNVGNAIFLQGRQRVNAAPANMSPVGAKVYDNVFIPVVTNDCNFVTMQGSNATYSPIIKNNYTGGRNPKDICTIVSSDTGSAFEFGPYWLNEECTDSSDLLAVKKITNTAGISFAGANIAVAPQCVIAVDVPHSLDEIELGLEVVKGAFYELYADADCTTPLTDNTLPVSIGVNYAYAKICYGEYSIVYQLIVTKKVAYSDYLDPSETVVSSEFAQYPNGQPVYVQIGDEWRRAVIGHSAYADLATAIANATNGDTINLTAGIYEGSITWNKGVKIKGPKAGINPNDMSSYDRSELRSNMDEEARFVSGMILAAGINGLTFDGVTFTQAAMFTFGSSFQIDGMQFRNMIFTAQTGTDSLLYRGRNDQGKQNMTNNVIYRCRFEGAGTSYIMRYSNISNGLFEENVFYNSTKSIYIGGLDGSASDVFTMKNNVFYGFTSSITLGDGSNTGVRVFPSFRFEGNKFINCTAGSIIQVRRWRSGANFTAVGNSFEGSTKGAFYIAPEPGYSGQSINIHENYFGDSVTSVLNSSIEGVADCSRNYYAKGPSDGLFVGDANYVPYYIDSAMTILSGDYQVLGVTAPEDATVDAESKTITYNATAPADEISFKLTVSDGASYALYADELCTKVFANDAVIMTGVNTTAYVKVTASDGKTSAVYTINITQPKNNKADMKGLDIEGSTWMIQGAGKYASVLPGSYIAGPLVPLTSAGATVSVYNGDDTEMKNPINYNTDIEIPVGKSYYIFKITSEDGTVSNIYNVSVSRSKSNLCDLEEIIGGLDFAIDGTTATVTYGYETDKIIPELKVSAGASYAFYEDIGANIRKTDACTLKVGENKVYVQITAEDGTQKIYTIIIVRNDRSAEKSINIAESFPTFALSNAELEADTEGKMIGMKRVENANGKIYLMPLTYISEINDELKVCEGATYEIFADYDFVNDEPIGTAISTNADQKVLKLAEGDNIFYVRISALNGTKTIFTMVVQNEIKNTEAELVDINGFTLKRDGNEISAVSDMEVTQIDFLLSTNATAKVYADRKKSIEVPTTMTTFTSTETQVVYSDCRLTTTPKQTFVKLYIDVVSQSGKKASYAIALTNGSKTTEFADVEGHWAEEYIYDAYSMGITSGSANPDGTLTFRPKDSATRQEVAIFVCNLMGVDATNYAKADLPYKDAKDISSWAKDAVRAVTAMGVFTGDGTNFNPKANISRQEFMTVIVRACALDTSKGKASHLSSFKDKGDVAAWAKSYVQTAVAFGLVNGDTAGRLNPKASITRAEIVKIMVCGKDFAR